MNAVIAGLPLIVVIASFGCGSREGASSPRYTIGFWYAPDSFSLPAELEARLGGEISAPERQLIEVISRTEIERAFADVAVRLSSDRRAFWRVVVLKSLQPRSRRALPAAGESLPLGILGGVGSVGFDFVASAAMAYAPLDSSRATIVEGIARGVGRVAVHELVHQMLGSDFADDFADEGSYEYGRADRPSQYYGNLHWGAAGPLLRARFGKRPGQ